MNPMNQTTAQPTEERSPLLKEKFLSGNRQKWTGILLVYSLIVAFLQVKFSVNPEPYMSFALTIGSIFLLGGSVDSVLKINAAKDKPKVTIHKLNQEREDK